MDTNLRVAADSFADHLDVGDVFSIYGFNGENFFRFAKIVALRSDSVHLFVYPQRFPGRPSPERLGSEMSLPENIETVREMYVAVSRKLFALLRPIFASNLTVADRELSGYRQWCLTGGIVAGDSFMMEDEIEDNWRVYVKIFFLTSLPFFVVFSIFYYFKIFGWLFDFVAAFKTSIAYGLAMVCLQWASIRQRRKEARGSRGRVSASSVQFSEVALSLGYSLAYEKAHAALSSLKNCKIVIADMKSGVIEARVRASLIEEGQEILVALFRMDDMQTGAIVWSESEAGMTVDLGRNLANVNKIIDSLHITENDNHI